MEYCEWKFNGFSWSNFSIKFPMWKRWCFNWGDFYINLTYSTDNLAEILQILFKHKCKEVNKHQNEIPIYMTYLIDKTLLYLPNLSLELES